MCERSWLRRANDEIIAHLGGGRVDNGGGGVLADGINRNDANIALRSELHKQRHEGVRFRIVPPFGAAERGWPARIINRDFFDIEHAKSRFAQLRFIER